MTINYLAVLVCSVLSMAMGAIWYGPLFGKKWAKIIGSDMSDAMAVKKMQQAAMPLYGIQFLLSLYQIFILAYYIGGWKDASGLVNAHWIWSAFILPTVAGASMWNNESPKNAWHRFLIQASYQFVMFSVYGLILGSWK